MRIVVLAPIEESVPPKKYGGIELVVYNQCQQMTAWGHEVYLLASGDSKTDADLIPLIPRSLRASYTQDEIDTWRQFIKINTIADALKHIREIQPDVVYNHQGWRFAPFIQFVGCPVFTTIHGPLQSPHERATFEAYPKTPLISISNNQRKVMPKLNWIKTIYNGIQLEQFDEPIDMQRDYFAFLGRTSPEKGLKEICKMILKTDKKLKIAAKIDTVDTEYYDIEIKPLIDGEQIEYIGEIGPSEKATFLSRTSGLLLWLNWEEPFGLVVIEAMACGTPVIVNPRGSMPEIVQHGKTGMLVADMDAMAKALGTVSVISPEACRQHVEKHFTASVMTKKYLQLVL